MNRGTFINHALDCPTPIDNKGKAATLAAISAHTYCGTPMLRRHWQAAAVHNLSRSKYAASCGAVERGAYGPPPHPLAQGGWRM